MNTFVLFIFAKHMFNNLAKCFIHKIIFIVTFTVLNFL